MYTVAICNMTCSRSSVADQEQQYDQQLSYRFAQQQQSQFDDPAIMSASPGVPLLSPQDALGNGQQTFGLPPGLAFPPGLQNTVVNDGKHPSPLVPEKPAACVGWTEDRASHGRDLFHQAWRLGRL